MLALSLPLAQDFLLAVMVSAIQAKHISIIILNYKKVLLFISLMKSFLPLLLFFLLNFFLFVKHLVSAVRKNNFLAG